VRRFRHGRPQGDNGHFPPIEIGTKNQNVLENLQSEALFRSIELLLAMTVYCSMTLTLLKSEFHNSGVVHYTVKRSVLCWTETVS